MVQSGIAWQDGPGLAVSELTSVGIFVTQYTDAFNVTSSLLFVWSHCVDFWTILTHLTISYMFTITQPFTKVLHKIISVYKCVSKEKRTPNSFPWECYRWCCRSNRSAHHWAKDRLTPAPAAPPRWWRGSQTGWDAPGEEARRAATEPCNTHSAASLQVQQYRDEHW